MGSPGAVNAFRTQRVLIVDDNVDAAELLGMLLRTWELDVKIAFDGADGLRAAAQFQPDTMVVDLQMPKVDGYGVASRIRTLRGDAIRLIALTAWGPQLHPDVLRRGFDVHLTKPVDPDRLRQALGLPPQERDDHATDPAPDAGSETMTGSVVTCQPSAK